MEKDYRLQDALHFHLSTEGERRQQKDERGHVRQELQAWQPDEAYWPDTAHFGLFNRWFRVEAYAEVRDAGRGVIQEETI